MNKGIMKVISLGMGRQSTALYYMSSMGLFDRVDMAIFADTGGEKTKTLEYYEYLLKWKDENGGIPIYKANYKNLENDLLSNKNKEVNRTASIPAFTNTNGKTGMLLRQCTSEYKIAQVNKKYREVLNLPGKTRFPKTEIWIGITVDEKERMSIPQEGWKINVYPFIGYKTFPDGRFEKIEKTPMSISEIIQWYKDNNLPIPEKSSCKFCPFQGDANWLRLKQLTPKDFKDAIKIDLAIRDSSKRGIKSPIYLHDSLKPLSEVNFNENQITIWGNCTDGCDI